ncbi:unnamed protein product [Rhizoctonia solani]|uniref:Glucanase n=1 Tax=Rhizoctonia solani TaxID=456999 RepID=A0A8H3GLX5_9AGAM|nr:unnamed protein product [Rhizoctonia solani]
MGLNSLLGSLYPRLINPQVDLRGKLAIVTGANSGIGFETARALATMGAHVVLACRNELRGQEARKQIVRLTGNPNVELEMFDCTSFGSVSAFLDRWEQRQAKTVDILVNNAGSLSGTVSITKDNYEQTYQSNHLAHVMLTHELLHRGYFSPTGRIVSLSSGGLYLSNGLNEHNATGQDVLARYEHEVGRRMSPDDMIQLYVRTKLSQAMWTMTLQRKLNLSEKWKDVSAHCCHPGLVQSPIWRQPSGPGATFGIILDVLRFTVDRFGVPSEQGAITPVWLATAPEPATECLRGSQRSPSVSFLHQGQPPFRHRNPKDSHTRFCQDMSRKFQSTTMKALSLVIAIAATFVAHVSAIPVLTRATDESNPFAGKAFYGNAYYRSLVEAEAGRLKAAGKAGLAAKAAKVAQVPVFSWVYDTSSVNDITGYLKDAAAVQKKTGKKQIVQLVIYNLPDRDCSSKAAAGELHLTSSATGVTPYQQLLNSAKSQIEKYPDVAVAIILEPDSIGDLVGSNSVAKCKNAAEAHKQLLSLAIATLQLPNVSLYLDGANAGWLGNNLAPTAELLGEILKDARIYHANATVRGLATNVSNYNGLGNQKEASRDELKYIKALAPYLEKVGYPAHFIVDQGRAGNQKAPHGDGEEWCNFKVIVLYAGFGLRPMVTTHPLVDAVVWVKPGGESDGTTDTSSSRFDTACTSPASYVPSPEAGDWHPEMFRLLIEQANPPF